MAANSENGDKELPAELEQIYGYDQLALTQLLQLESQMRAHHQLWLKQLVAQKVTLKSLWILCNRYLHLVSTGHCCYYLEAYLSGVEATVILKYGKELAALRDSNSLLMASVDELRKSIKLFEHYCSKLNKTAGSSPILGNAHKPFSYFIELVSDCFAYFHGTVLNLSYRANLMEPTELTCLEEYMVFLEPSDESEQYLMMELTYCKCLQPHPADLPC